jgi:voltage-gated potassium channel
LLLSAIALVGTGWFWLIEGWSLVDAAYQTATTVTTVGFGETRPFDTSAKVFSILLMVLGVSAALFTLGAVFEQQIERGLQRIGRRRMDRRIESLSGHTIVCGYGRVGARTAALLGGKPNALVVVDSDAERVGAAVEDGHLAVFGDSTEDATLHDAGIERASKVVVSLADDAAAISTVLSARVLSPTARIVARANAESSEAKLVRAGCDHVVNPLHQGAGRLAAFAEQPAVADFLDVVVHDGSLEYRLEELVLPPGSPLTNASLGEAHVRSRTGALVLALREADGTFLSNPGPGVQLTPGCTLIVIGTEDQLAALAAHAGARAAPGPADVDATST